MFIILGCLMISVNLVIGCSIIADAIKEAARILERGASRYPSYVFVRVVLVATYGQLGKKEEARRNAEEVKRLLPIFDPEVFGSRFRDAKLRKYLTEGLKKGGLL